MHRLALASFFCFSLFSNVQAAEFSLFSSDSELTQHQQAFTQLTTAPLPPVLGHPISTSDSLKQVQVNDTISFQTPNSETIRILIKQRISHSNGDISLSGHLDSADYTANITRGSQGSFATINSVSGQYKIDMRGGQEWFSTPDDRSRMQVPPFGDDAIAPPPLPQQQNSNLENLPTLALSAAMAPSTAIAHIDILVFYTPEFSTSLGGPAAAQTRINNIFSISNQAYANSGLLLEINPIHVEQLAAPNNEGDIVALDKFRLSEGVFSNVHNLRVSTGADAVILFQKYTPSHSGCGLAYILGSNSGTLLGTRDYAYGFVQDGTYPDPDGGDFYYFCYDSTLAHELGHTFGFAHDRNHSSLAGAFPYSYGHDDLDNFATIMSYDTPKIELFSSPNLSCSGQPCGIAEGQANSADNVKSGNQIRFDIARFYSPPVSPTSPGNSNEDTDINAQDALYSIGVILGSESSTDPANCSGGSGVDINDLVCTINAILSR